MFEMAGVKVRKAANHWPAIVTIVSVGGIAYGVYKMCKASTKLNEAMEPHRKMEESIVDSHNKGVIDDAEFKKKIGMAKIEQAKDVAKLYAPGFLLVASSTLGFLFSNRELGKRVVNAQNMALQYHDSYQKLKQNVQNAIGKKATQAVEHQINSGIRTVEDEVTGKKIEKNYHYMTVDGDMISASIYSVFFNNTCNGFDEDSRKNNYEYLKSLEHDMNNRLRRKGYLWLSDVYNALGIVPDNYNEAIKNSGWIDPNGKFGYLIKDTNGVCKYEDKIDFCLNDIELHKYDNNEDPIWLLDFNCYHIGHLI
ncbi:MAG: hypothetical protein HXL60_07585 [Solobacterium sp.]|nr:hypothetical protein [Solobacterium sp.]